MYQLQILDQRIENLQNTMKRASKNLETINAGIKAGWDSETITNEVEGVIRLLDWFGK